MIESLLKLDVLYDTKIKLALGVILDGTSAAFRKDEIFFHLYVYEDMC